MRLIILSILFTPSLLIACPIGMQSDVYGFGNVTCTLSGEVKTIKGSLLDCPEGFDADHDQWGNPVCFDNNIMAYDLSGGCPKNLTGAWDSHGRLNCLDFKGQTVVELAD